MRYTSTSSGDALLRDLADHVHAQEMREAEMRGLRRRISKLPKAQLRLLDRITAQAWAEESDRRRREQAWTDYTRGWTEAARMGR